MKAVRWDGQFPSMLCSLSEGAGTWLLSHMASGRPQGDISPCLEFGKPHDSQSIRLPTPHDNYPDRIESVAAPLTPSRLPGHFGLGWAHRPNSPQTLGRPYFRNSPSGK
ncbi:hypothetical protein chiPu_0029485 [Chiloscyllium punctatum]|uniref:Uncharacterized protein n=1 Tax=Chiloscyllium punctatum TaxID=137246 RepID=A0A401TRD6_CHIPU|nr:hypothetical protein [Chiloscyllium punctatum]